MCQANDACQSFVLFYAKLECYWYENDVTEFSKDARREIDNDAAWFVKVCLKEGKLIRWINCRIRNTYSSAYKYGNDLKFYENL